MKEKYEVFGTINYWLGTLWMLGSLFIVVATKFDKTTYFFLSYLVGTLFWGLAQIEVNGKYLRDIRDAKEKIGE